MTILSRYADVSTALADPRLSGGGETDQSRAHVAVRAAARDALSTERLAEWRDELRASARRFANDLSADESVDLVRAFAEPWSLALAITATNAARSDAHRLAELAREVFIAAAMATSSDVPPHAQHATAELSIALASSKHGASADVQTFVALSQTLPRTLAAVWLALFEHPDELARLRAQPKSMPKAVDELFRFAGPSRAVFRRARAEVVIGDARIRADDHVTLLLSAANRDPERFENPDRLDLTRDVAGHLAFGRGAHSCSGASVVRMAVAVATSALLERVAGVTAIGDVEWIDGFAIRAPNTLPVQLQLTAELTAPP